MNLVLTSLVVFTFLLAGPPAAAQKKISENGKPLTFQVIRASATREPQLSEKPSGEYAMPGLTAGGMVGGGTYRGSITEIPRFEPMPLGPLESFLIVEFRVTNVRRKLLLSETDVQLVDGRGSVYNSLGRQGQKQNSWGGRTYFNGLELETPVELAPQNMPSLRWIFRVPTDSISGAALRFQNATYPVNPVSTPSRPAPAASAQSSGADTPTVFASGIVSGESVEALRAAEAVRALQPLEDSKSINNLPGGVYGFTVPWIINTNPSGVMGGRGVDRIILHRSPFGTIVMEIHKRQTGEVYVVGYVSKSDLARFRDSSTISDSEATMFFGPNGDFSLAVAIPLSRIGKSNYRRVEGRAAIDVLVGAQSGQ